MSMKNGIFLRTRGTVLKVSEREQKGLSLKVSKTIAKF